MNTTSFRKLFTRMAAVGALLAACVPAWAVDINHAGAEEIARQLHNIGLMKAHAIVAYRKQHGMFKTVDDLQKIEGIGPRTVEMNRGKITIGTAGRNKAAGSGAEASGHKME